MLLAVKFSRSSQREIWSKQLEGFTHLLGGGIIAGRGMGETRFAGVAVRGIRRENVQRSGHRSACAARGLPGLRRELVQAGSVQRPGCAGKFLGYLVSSLRARNAHAYSTAGRVWDK